MKFKLNKGKVITEVVKDNLCTGCGTCVALCPLSAIEMVKDDSKGIYLPRLEGDKCNQCGICFDVCPGHSVDFKELNQDIFGREPDDILLGNYLNCYIGHATDYDIRYNSSSGGLVTALLIFALEEEIIDGALVTRMKKDKPLEPEPFVARTREEIIEASKSKYCPVPANIALKEILEKDGKYAVVGLPCHIQGIRKAEMVNKKLRERIALHVGIFCSGIPNFRATEYLLRTLNLRVEDIAELSYRGEGWPGNMSLYFKGGNTELIPYPVYWDGFGSLFFLPRCIGCLDWFSKLADISLGDAWLPEIKEADGIGTSIIVSRTKEADDILQQMLRKGAIALSPISADKVYETQGGLSHKKKQLKARLTISRLFGRKVPVCNYDHLPQPSLPDYLNSALLYAGSLFASKRSLWWLLDIYCSLLRYGSRLKSKLGL